MVDLRRVRFVRCDLSNAHWERLRLEEVIFDGCRLTGFRMTNSKCAKTAFIKCTGQYVQLDRCQLPALRFDHCDLRESSLMGCDFERATFADCDFTNSVITQCTMKNADWRGTNISGLRAALEEMRGAIIDPEQATSLLVGSAGIAVVPVGAEVPTIDA